MSLVEIVPLGGAGEIGRNCTVVIQNDEMIVVDCGISFPNEEQPGVEIVIPDFTFLVQNKHKVKGVFLTHAHEDHVGALAFLLADLKVPVYGTEFTLNMLRNRLEERMPSKAAILRSVKVGDKVQEGSFEVEFLHMTHSIPDSCALAIQTLHGVVLFTGDFRLDFTPVDRRPPPMARLAELSREGVVLLLSDCTNVDRPGWGPSESIVIKGFKRLFEEAEGRILITTFASNIFRMQQALEAAQATGRKVAIAGRRMEQTMDLCAKMGILRPPPGIRIPLDSIDSYAPEELVILSTGSQGEPRSALVQLSRNTYSRMRIKKGDTVLYSARAIPGNEGPIWRTVSRLNRLGAKVIMDSYPPIHVSGHGYQDELKTMIAVTQPFYLAPVHGEPRHQEAYLELARGMGHPEHRMFHISDGEKLVMDEERAWVEAFISAEPKLLDRSGQFFVGNQTMEERRMLSEQGIAILRLKVDKKMGCAAEPPEITTVGFAGEESDLEKVMDSLVYKLDRFGPEHWKDLGYLKSQVEDALRGSFYRECKSRPMILAFVSAKN